MWWQKFAFRGLGVRSQRVRLWVGPGAVIFDIVLCFSEIKDLSNPSILLQVKEKGPNLYTKSKN